MLPLSLMIGVVVVDQLTKMWVMETFVYSETRQVLPGLFNLTYLTNTGVAFGMFAGEENIVRQVFFVAVAVVALVALYFAFRHFKEQGRLFSIAIGLIAGGAIGNLIDRLRHGAVVDFLDFYIKNYHWPAFNLADSAITVGVGLFVLGHFLYPEDSQ